MDINRDNYETFFLLYLDRELQPSEMIETEKFLSENADLQKEFALLQRTIFLPVETVFDQKELLLRKEEKRRVVPFYPMRIAAAVAVLVLVSWLITMQHVKNHSVGVEGNGKLSEVKNPAHTEVKPADRTGETGNASNNNQTAQSKAEMNNGTPTAQENLAAPSNNTSRENLAVSSDNASKENLAATSDNASKEKLASISDNSSKNAGTPGVGMKSRNNPVEKNSLYTEPVKPNQDIQNPVSNIVTDEPALAKKKSSALELQSAENQTGVDLKQIAGITGTQAPVLLLASVNATDQSVYENVVLYEQDNQTDNAISVVALNDQNKGISKFFKKLTQRVPAEGNERKIRVSVFQLSY